ncbi:ImmA/IrrE family metallo-endopeptidase [Labrys sp. LIt4]|uniref:ImmA/IrrE family metallo-endopeptidase n=1 Tax=Labrys sp. LIt4 TaxID=2821355 RepID=UPI0032AFF622
MTKLGIKTARGISGRDRLTRMEAGETEVTRPLLVKMAKLYRRPLLAFYMAAPPAKGNRGEDFRSLPERLTDAEPLVDALVRDVKARQSMVRSMLEDEEAEPLEFVGSMSMTDGVGPVIASIRRTLDIDLLEFRAQGTPEAAFALLREKVEAAGVFVLLIGNLGSHHSNLAVEAFRGFALADPLAPFIVINDQDAKTAWSFTLLHELAHIWVGATGVSGAYAEGRLERFCNDVASGFLLSGQELVFLAAQQHLPLADLAGLISQFARDRLISKSLVAYRMFRAGTLTEANWRQLASQFQAEWQAARQVQRERARDREGGPNYYVVRRHRLGTALLRLVARNLDEGALTPTRASKVLGVKPRSVAPLLNVGPFPLAQAG